MAMQTKFIYWVLLMFSIISCTNFEEIKIYSLKNNDTGLRPIFYENGKFYHITIRDSTSLIVISVSEILSYNSKKLFLVKLPKREEFLSIEGSNYQGGNYNLDYNFNYDFLIKDNHLYLNIIYPKERKNTYLIILSQGEMNLIKSTVSNFNNIKSDHNISGKFTLAVNFRNKRESNFFVKNIDNAEVSLFYDSMMFIIIKHIIRKKDYTLLKNKIKISTSSVYEGIRNVPGL